LSTADSKCAAFFPSVFFFLFQQLLQQQQEKREERREKRSGTMGRGSGEGSGATSSKKGSGGGSGGAASPGTKRGRGAKNDEHVQQEFGGPIGAASIIVFSHFLPYYMWISNFYYGGAIIHPESLSDVGPWFQRMLGHIAADAMPTTRAFAIYFAFLTYEALLAMLLPGLVVKGLPIKSEGGRRLDYTCNALTSWYVTLATAAGLHFSGLFRITEIFDNFGSLMTVSMIAGDVITLLIYASAFAFGK